MNLTSLKAAVLDRTGILSTDALATSASLTLAINAAIHRIETANPNGWDWLRSPASFTLVPGTGSYGFAAISFVSGIGSFSKVVEAHYVASGVEYPLRRVTHSVLRTQFLSTASGRPEQYAVEGRTVYLAPLPANADTVRLTVVLEEPDLASGSDTPLMTAIFHDAIVEQAAALIFRRTQNLGAAQVADAEARQWIGKMFAYQRGSVGPSKVAQEWG